MKENLLFLFFLFLSTTFFQCAEEEPLRICNSPNGLKPINAYIDFGQSNVNPAGSDIKKVHSRYQAENDSVLIYTEFLNQPEILHPGVNTGETPGSFGKEVSQHFEATEKRLVLKFWRGGNGLCQSDDKSDWNPESSGEAFDDFKTFLLDGLDQAHQEGYWPNVLGIHWTHGEADSKTETCTNRYFDNFNMLMDSVLALVQDKYCYPPVVIISELDRQLKNPFVKDLRAVQKDLANSNASWHLLKTNGYSTFDRVHYDEKTLIRMGLDAEKILE